jgi:hypothetical protein
VNIELGDAHDVLPPRMWAKAAFGGHAKLTKIPKSEEVAAGADFAWQADRMNQWWVLPFTARLKPANLR